MVYKYLIYFLAILQFSTAVYGQKTDSLKSQLPETKGAERIELLHELVISVWLNYPSQGMRYGHEALDLAMRLQDSTNISKSLRLIAGVHYYKGDFDASLEYNLKALEIAEAIRDSVLVNNGYNNIGLLYYNLGSYPTAFEYLLRSRAMKEKIGEEYGMSTTLNNLGLVFMKVSDFETARGYFFDALEIARGRKNDDLVVYSQNNIALTYLRENNPDAALLYFEQALSLAQKVSNINWGAVSLRGIGEILGAQGKIDSARYYYDRSLEASLSIDDKRGIAEVYYLYAKLEFQEKNSGLAIEYLQKGHAAATQLGDRHQLLDNLELFTQIYLNTNNQQEAIRYQSSYLQLQDSLFQDIASRNLALIPIKLNEEENRLHIARQNLEIQQKAMANRFYGAVIIIAAIFLVSMFILLRKIRKVNQLQKQTLKEIAFVEAHQLRGPISSLLGVINLLETNPNNQDEQRLYVQKVKELAMKIDRVSKEIIQKSDQDHES